MEGVTIVVILVLVLLSAGAAAWLLRKKDNAPVDKAVRVPAGSTARVPAVPKPVPAIPAPLVKPPGIAESPTPKPVIMKSIARRPIEQKIVPKPMVIAPMPRPNKPVIAPMPRPNKPVIAPNMPAFPKTAVQPFVKPASKCAPDDPTKFDYVRRANAGGKWVCPAGTVDTGCTWADGIHGERQCRKPKAPKPPANVIVRPSTPAAPPASKCAPDDPAKFDYVRRANAGGKWVCPAGTVDTGCTWADGIHGERQCRKPKAPKPPANVIVNAVGGAAKKVGGGAVGFFKGLFS